MKNLTFRPLPSGSKTAGWQWPVRIGFSDDRESMELLDRFWAAGSPLNWVRALIRIVEVDTSFERNVDLLVVPGNLRRATEQLEGDRERIHAACVAIIGESGKENLEQERAVGQIRELTGADAVFFVVPNDFGKWLVNLLDDLSHSKPLDVALAGSRNLKRGIPSTLWSTGDFLTVPSLGDALLLKELILAGTQEKMARPPEETAGPEEDLDRTKGEIQPQPVQRVERFLQAEVKSGGQILTRAFRKKCEHTIRIHIGPPEKGKIGVPDKFPEEKLPPTTADGWNLTISFFEPNLMKQPQVGPLFLPKTGRSDSCPFKLYIPQEADHVEARIIVLHKNRIIQNTILSGPVTDDSRRETTEAGSGAGILFRSSFMVPFANRDPDKRSQFQAAFLLNHTGETPGVYQVKDNRSLFVRLDSATIADLVDQVEGVIDRSEWDLPEFEGLTASGTTELLRELAWAGSSLYQSVIKRIDPGFAADTAPINGTVQKIQVVCANVSSRMPFEFIYDFPAPGDDTPICPRASEALRKGSCELCEEKEENPAKVICPLGFWCMSRIIEWHAFTEESAQSTQNAPFVLQTGGLGDPSWLMVMKDPLVGYSNKVTAARKSSIRDLKASFKKVGITSPTIVTSWDQWKENITRLQPSLEVLLVHTEKKGPRTMIEIGRDMLSTLNLEGYITDKKSWPAIVLLLGCGTGTSRVQFQSVAAMVEACHAAIIVSTTSDVFGPIASRLAGYFVEQLGTLEKSQSFGEVMLAIRRKALAEGVPMVLCLRSYGDADWQLITS